MLYWLLFQVLHRYVPAFRVFGYITTRVALANLTALALALALGPWLIRKLRRWSFGQHIREEGPQSHQKKAGTPTMGGLLIVAAIVVPTLLWADLEQSLRVDRAAWAGGIRRDRLHRRLRQAREETKSRADREAEDLGPSARAPC